MFTIDFMFTQVIIDHYSFRAKSFSYYSCSRIFLLAVLQRVNDLIEFSRHFLVIYPEKLEISFYTKAHRSQFFAPERYTLV